MIIIIKARTVVSSGGRARIRKSHGRDHRGQQSSWSFTHVGLTWRSQVTQQAVQVPFLRVLVHGFPI